MNFICDRMLGKLAVWLRIAGYDTLYIGDFECKDEDSELLKNFLDRILLTKDRELYQKAIKNKRAVFLVVSNDVAEQMKELKKIGVSFQLLMDRCSVCNCLLRKPSREEALEVMIKEGISEDIGQRYELWYCERCKKLYWMGSHWRNMVEFLKKLDQ